MDPNKPKPLMDLQLAAQRQEIQRERLKELREYKLGKKGEFFDKRVINDFYFFFGFLPEHLQNKARDYLTRANHSQVVEALIDLLEQEVGESPIAQVIELRTEGSTWVPDLSNQELYKELLNKFREMQKFYRWDNKYE